MTSHPPVKSPELLTAANSRLVIIDVQQKFVPVIPKIDQVIGNCIKLLKGAQILEVPCDAAEQYPQGLGPTVDQLATYLPNPPAKMRFSAAPSFPWWSDAPETSPERYQVVVAGIETHVCVLQTVFDLMARGFEVFVVVDAVNGRLPLDHEIGLKRMADAGARLVTTEMVLFEWCETAGTEIFKQLSRIITGRDETGSGTVNRK